MNNIYLSALYQPQTPKGALSANVIASLPLWAGEAISLFNETASFLAVTAGSPFRGLGLKNEIFNL
jgi:hypothetical protein